MFGGDEEVQQTLQRIAAITFLNEPKQLTEDGGSRHLERWEEGGESALDGRVQRLWVLGKRGRERDQEYDITSAS